MAGWPLGLWEKVNLIVQEERYIGANEEFTQLKGAVLGADAALLEAQKGHAQLAWTFIVGFAEKKSMYRNHLTKVIRKLMESPPWQGAYLAMPELQSKAAELHPDLQAVLGLAAAAAAATGAMPPAPAPLAASEAAVEGATGAGIDWPNWESIEAMVTMGGFSGANDEFLELRNVVKEASSADLETQAAHAPAVWAFLVGFAAKKALYRSQIAAAARTLKQAPSWLKALEAGRGELAAQVAGSSLHPDLVEVFGFATPPPPGGAAGPGAGPGAGPEASAAGASGGAGALSAFAVAVAASAAAHTVDDDEVSSVEPVDDIPDEGDMQEVPVGTVRRKTTEGDLNKRLAALDAPSPVAGGPSSSSAAPGPAATAEPQQPQQSALAKQLLPFLHRASEADQDGSDPLVAHYFRVHVVEQLLRAKAKRGGLDPESLQMLLRTLDEAEKKKAILDLSDGRASFERLAQTVYSNACAAEGVGAPAGAAGAAGVPAAEQLYIAALFVEALAQFHKGELPFDLAQVSQYARARALHLRESERTGSRPSPPQPPLMRLAAPAALAASAPSPAMAAAPPPFVPEPRPGPSAPSAPSEPSAPSAPAAPSSPSPPPAAPPSAPAAAPPASPPAAAPPSAEPAPAAAAASVAALSPPPRPASAPSTAAAAVPAEFAGWSALKRKGEARRRAESAAAALEAGTEDQARARRLVVEALQLLEGLA